MSTETRHKITNKSCVQFCFVKHGLINSGRKTLNINLNGATVIFSNNIFMSLLYRKQWPTREERSFSDAHIASVKTFHRLMLAKL